MSNQQKNIRPLRMALRYARRRAYCAPAEAAKLLHVTEQELLQYENGTADIPQAVLEMLITMGYTMLRARLLQTEYRNMRRILVRENIPFDVA